MGSGFKQISIKYGVYYWEKNDIIASNKYFLKKPQVLRYVKAYMRKH